MTTYVSNMFPTSAEAEAQRDLYQTRIEQAGGTVHIRPWERTEVDVVTRVAEATNDGETIAAVTKASETLTETGPVLFVTLPEDVLLAELLPESEALAFKVIV